MRLDLLQVAPVEPQRSLSYRIVAIMILVGQCPGMKGNRPVGVQTSEKLLCTGLIAGENVLRAMRDASFERDRVDDEARHAGGGWWKGNKQRQEPSSMLILI